MALNIQGNWKIQVITKNPQSLPQRFIVTGAVSGNGVYIGTTLSPIVQVIGTNWQMKIQANESYEEDGLWLDSTMVALPTQIVNGEYVQIINSEDLIQDNSFDDLVLRLTSPVPVVVTPPPVDPVPVIPVDPTIPIVPDPIPPVVPQPPPDPNLLGYGKVYTKFENADILPTAKIKIASGIWLDSTGSASGNMTSFFTASWDTGSFKRTAYQMQFDACCAAPHFDIAYGNIDGSGSRDLGGNDFYTPSNAVYSQFANICLDNANVFTIGTKTIKHFYAITIKRDRLKDSADPGLFELNLHQLSGSQFLTGNGNRNAHTGSNVRLGAPGNIIRLIDDSRLDLENGLSAAAYSTFYQSVSESKCRMKTTAGDVYYIVSGNLETGMHNQTNPHVYGLSYPNVGLLILDADLLDTSASFLTVTGSDVNGANYDKMLRSISGSALYTDATGDVLGFQYRRIKYDYVKRFFVRVKNQDYNFTNNPTYTTGSEGTIKDDFIGKPKVYITSIGLYNDNHELLAVGKISRPILKQYSDEGLFKVSLKLS